MSNEKTNLFNISFCNVPDITFFCLFTGTTEEGRRCPQWRRCQRSGTYQSIESHRGSRHSDRLYSRHQYGIYSRWTLRHRLYSGTTGQYGTQTGLDFPFERSYQTQCHVAHRTRTLCKIHCFASFHKEPESCHVRRNYQRTESSQSVL